MDLPKSLLLPKGDLIEYVHGSVFLDDSQLVQGTCEHGAHEPEGIDMDLAEMRLGPRDEKHEAPRDDEVKVAGGLFIPPNALIQHFRVSLKEGL
jgi:hypothetical protein